MAIVVLTSWTETRYSEHFDRAAAVTTDGGRTCLLVTYLSLTRLTERTNGSYRRLALLAAAIRASGASLRVCCALTSERPVNQSAEACKRIEGEIRKAWSMDSTVVASMIAPPSNARWILQQAAGSVRDIATARLFDLE